MKKPFEKEIIGEVVGLPELFTEVVDKDGVREQCQILSFTPMLVGEKAAIVIKYKKTIVDENGKVIEAKVNTKPMFIKDRGEIGLVEYDEAHEPIMDTYEKVEDENLAVTKWYNNLGAVVYPELLKMVNKFEKYI